MSSKNIHPSTLDGIKRLAKSIKIEQDIRHGDALDLAARAANFENFKHARNTLVAAQPVLHQVIVSAYWRNKTTKISGRETLIVMLSKPWNSLILPSQLTLPRALNQFRTEGPDHLVSRYSHEFQSQARRAICAVARTFQFMDATSLRPSNGFSRAYPPGVAGKSIPGADHTSIWYDKETKRYLIADEPYERAAQEKHQARLAWAEHHDFVIARPAWSGMYNPDGGSQLYLITDLKKGIDLPPLLTKLSKLSAPFVEDDWNGESAPSIPYFVSPGRLAQLREVEKPTLPRHSNSEIRKPTQKKSNTIGYVQTFVGPQRRPLAKMPIEAHTQIGSLLKSVLTASYKRKGVYNRVNSVRSDLDEWVQREYTEEELPSNQFFNLYYRESSGIDANSMSATERTLHAKNLGRVKQILNEHYPDSGPLRTMQKRLDAAIKSMQSWGNVE